MKVEGEESTLALVSLYSQPDDNLLRLSHNALLVCARQLESRIVVDVSTIQSVVAVVPFQQVPGRENAFFVVEKLGLAISDLGGDGEMVGEV